MVQAQPSAPREAARTARRQALLETAEQVFAERGFAGATMAEIASRAGYSAGNLYNVFESKEALFREVCRETGNLLYEQQMAVLRADLPFAEAIERLTQSAIEFCIQHRAFFVIYVRTTSGLGWNIESFGEEAQRIERDREAALLGRIERAIADGEIEAGEPRVATSLASGSFHHLVVRWIQDGGSPDSLRTEARSLLRLLCRGLGVKGGEE
jgi:AcrR family transcriptional regulator